MVAARARRIAPYLLAAALFAAYAPLSVARHLRLKTTGYDLGIFEQAVRGYARPGAPVSELKGPGFHLLGDHFHPILILLAPVYRVFPSPLTLVVAQAFLVAVSAVPITRLALATVGPAGLGIGVAYGLSWGAQQAIAFDFHEVCFAAPLLAFSLERLARAEWSRAVAWALPLALVKEDLPLTVAAIGGYLVLRRQRALGAAVIAVAVAAAALIVLVLIPAFHPDHLYAYGSGAVEPSVARLVQPPAVKARTLLLALAPTAFVALRSPVLLIALPTLGWRFGSDNPAYWGTNFHYSLVLMPILFVAFVDGLARLRASRHRPWRRYAAAAVPLALAVTAVIGAQQPLSDLVRPGFWREGVHATEARRVLDLIPDGASVSAVNSLAPQLTARCQVYLFPSYPTARLRPEWIVLTDPPDASLVPTATVEAGTARLADLGYQQVEHRDGIVLWRQIP